MTVRGEYGFILIDKARDKTGLPASLVIIALVISWVAVLPTIIGAFARYVGWQSPGCASVEFAIFGINFLAFMIYTAWIASE